MDNYMLHVQESVCNGTRLAVKKTMENLIEATILTGPFEGEAVLIPRIPMIPTDLPFQFKRLQFPIRLAFAITINKAQGQSLKKLPIILLRNINPPKLCNGTRLAVKKKKNSLENLIETTNPPKSATIL